MQLFDEIIHASLVSKDEKVVPLKKSRIMIEKLKHLVRMEHEMNIIDEKKYIRISGGLVEISKMTTGWLKNVLQK